MGKLAKYKVELRNMREDACSYVYELTNQFFTDIDASEIHKGHLDVQLKVKKSIGAYVLDFHITGSVTVPCDRCLSDLELPVDTENVLKVKLGAEFSDEDDMVIVPEEDGYINVAWFLYEFIELSLPMKHVHAPGKCNKGMMGVLKNEEVPVFDDEENDLPDGGEETPTDPRWNELKKILDNN